MRDHESRSELKARHKVSAGQADDRSKYKETDYGRTRRNRVLRFLKKMIALAGVPFIFLARCRVRWRTSLSRRNCAGKPPHGHSRGHAPDTPEAPDAPAVVDTPK